MSGLSRKIVGGKIPATHLSPRPTSRAVIPYSPTSKAVVPYSPESKAVVPYSPQSTALVPYSPQSTALIPASPKSTALIPSSPKPTSLIPYSPTTPTKEPKKPKGCEGCDKPCSINNILSKLSPGSPPLQRSSKDSKKSSKAVSNPKHFNVKMSQAAETSGGSLEDRISNPPKTSDEGVKKSGSEEDGAGDALGGSSLQEPDYSVEVKLSDMQADPNNPLYSVKTFQDLGLDERVLQGLSFMNFRKPSKVQERALPLLMANPPTNLVGQSQSGTGKTAAFVLNILSRIDLSNEQAQSTPQALILAPTRELARQIVGVIQIMGQFLDNLTIGTAVPMDSANRPSRMACSIVVGTPGTVLEMMKRRILNPLHLKVLVLDEADNMLDQQGLGDQCIRVKSMLPKTIQVVLFSATFPSHVYRYAQTFAPNANEITLKHEELTVEGIKQLYMDCADEEDKYRNLVQLYGLLTVGSSIIFVRTRNSAVEIERRMVAEGHTVASLTGGIEGTQRDTVIDAFRSGEAKVLITTNVLARGIDVSTVSLVINYDIPEIHSPHRGAPKQPDYQTYLHRIGRTGRFGRIGVAITFMANQEEWQMLRMIQEHFQCNIDRIDTSDWDEVEVLIKKTIKHSRAQAKIPQ